MLPLLLTAMIAAAPPKPCDLVVAELGMPDLAGLADTLAPKYQADAVTDEMVKKSPEKYPVRFAALNAAEAVRESYKLKPMLEIFERRVEAEKENVTAVQKKIAATILKLREATDDLEKAATKRKSEKSARWQANLDFLLAETRFRTGTLEELNLAYGLVHRNELPPVKGSNTGWKLGPAEKMHSKSDIRKLVEDSQADFEAIQKTYPGSPWAKLAERELAIKPGLAWDAAVVAAPPPPKGPGMRKKP